MDPIYYAYKGDILCVDCAADLMCELGVAADDGDTEHYPQAEMGSGEADCPLHCTHCCMLVPHALTGEGRAYVARVLWADECPHDWADQWPELSPPAESKRLEVIAHLLRKIACVVDRRTDDESPAKFLEPLLDEYDPARIH